MTDKDKEIGLEKSLLNYWTFQVSQEQNPEI